MAKRRTPTIVFGWKDVGAIYEYDGQHVPRRFGVTIDDPAFPYLVSLDVCTESGHAECESLHAERRADGPPVTSDGLRKLPIARLVSQAVMAAGVTLSNWPAGPANLTLQDRNPAVLADARRIAETTTRRRRSLDDAFLREVAAVWKAGDPGARTKAVADHWNTVRQNARKWVAAARAAGLIPEEDR